MIDQGQAEFGVDLVALILGIDRLYVQSLPSDPTGLGGEGWVAINLSKVTPDTFESYDDARVRTEEMRSRLQASSMDGSRRRYYSDYLKAIDTFCVWRDNGDLAYADLLGLLLNVPDQPPDLSPLLTQLERKLRDAGFSGSVIEMIAGFRESRTVPATEVVDVLNSHLAQARAWVSREMFPLPEEFQFRVEGERGLPYDAYCEYAGRFIRINLDIHFTHEDLKHLACHEAYPGHSTHILRREQLVRAGAMAEDGLLVVTDTPTNTLFEGIGEVGAALVGWDQTEAEQINECVIQLLAAVSAWAGHLFARGRRDEARELLNRYGDPAWVRSRELLLDLPLRRPFVYAYYFGHLLVRTCWAASPNPRTFFSHLYDRMHSPASFRMTPW